MFSGSSSAPEGAHFRKRKRFRARASLLERSILLSRHVDRARRGPNSLYRSITKIPTLGLFSIFAEVIGSSKNRRVLLWTIVPGWFLSGLVSERLKTFVKILSPWVFTFVRVANWDRNFSSRFKHWSGRFIAIIVVIFWHSSCYCLTVLEDRYLSTCLALWFCC